MSEGASVMRVALITGASGGIGLAVCEELLAEGVRVVASDLPGMAVDHIEQILPLATRRGMDVTSQESVQEAVRWVEEEYGRLDILVNAAGVLKPTGIVDITQSEWDWVVNVNLKGTFLTTQAATPLMRRTGGGRIINISSTAGKSVSTVGGAHYTAAKAGVLGFTRHAARELGGDGITVNAVCPGLIDTEMVRDTIDGEQIAAYAELFPINRLGLPSEVAALVAFLASEKAAYVTGASMDINGGDLTI